MYPSVTLPLFRYRLSHGGYSVRKLSRPLFPGTHRATVGIVVAFPRPIFGTSSFYVYATTVSRKDKRLLLSLQNTPLPPPLPSMCLPTRRQKVIRKMAANLQAPDPGRISWERYTAIIEPFEKSSHGVEAILENGASATSPKNRFEVPSTCREDVGRQLTWDTSMAGSFWEAVAAAAKYPVPPLPVSSSNILGQVLHGTSRFIFSVFNSRYTWFKLRFFLS